MFDYGSHDLHDPLPEPSTAPEHTLWSFMTNVSIKELNSIQVYISQERKKKWTNLISE